MKRFLTAVVAAFFLMTTVAHAATVPIFDRSVDILLTDMKKLLSAANLPPIRGTRYYTGKDGFRYCESYFGSSNKNRLIFRLNDKGAAWSAGITYAADQDQDLNATSAGLLLSLIMGYAGMSDAEGQRFADKMTTWLDKSVAQNLNNATTTASVWCANAKRYFELKVSVKDALSRNNGIFTFFLSAHNT